MGKLLIATALVGAGVLVQTGHIQIGGSSMRKTTGAIGSYSAAPSAAISGITSAASKIAK